MYMIAPICRVMQIGHPTHEVPTGEGKAEQGKVRKMDELCQVHTYHYDRGSARSE